MGVWEIVAAIAAVVGAGTAAYSASRGMPDVPQPEAPPKPPTIDEAARRQAEGDAKRRRRGRAATILTGPQGAGTPQTATKALLGE